MKVLFLYLFVAGCSVHHKSWLPRPLHRSLLSSHISSFLFKVKPLNIPPLLPRTLLSWTKHIKYSVHMEPLLLPTIRAFTTSTASVKYGFPAGVTSERLWSVEYAHRLSSVLWVIHYNQDFSVRMKLGKTLTSLAASSSNNWKLSSRNNAGSCFHPCHTSISFQRNVTTSLVEKWQIHQLPSQMQCTVSRHVMGGGGGLRDHGGVIVLDEGLKQ